MKLELRTVKNASLLRRTGDAAKTQTRLLQSLPQAAMVIAYPADAPPDRVDPVIVAVNAAFVDLLPRWRRDQQMTLSAILPELDRQFLSLLASLPPDQAIVERIDLRGAAQNPVLAQSIELHFGPITKVGRQATAERTVLLRDMSQQALDEAIAVARATIATRTRNGGTAVESLINVCALADQLLFGCATSVFIRGRGASGAWYRRVAANRFPAAALNSCVRIDPLLQDRLVSGAQAPFSQSVFAEDRPFLAAVTEGVGDDMPHEPRAWFMPIRLGNGETKGFIAVYHKLALTDGALTPGVVDILHNVTELAASAWDGTEAAYLNNLVPGVAKTASGDAVHCFWEVDSLFKFKYLSDEFTSIFHLKRSLIVGSSALPYFRSLMKSTHGNVQLLQQISRRKPFENVFARFCDGDGHTRFLQISGWPITGPNNALRGYRGAIHDVTERYGLRYRTRLAEQRLAGAVESLNEGFLLFGPDQRLVLFNERAQQIAEHAGLSLHVNRSLSELVSRKLAVLPNRLSASHEPHKAPGLPRRSRTFQIAIDTEKWVRVSENTTDEGGTVLRWTDISVEKRREAQLQASERRFQDMTNNLPGVVFQLLVDHEGKIVFTFVSSGIKDLLNIEAKDAIANPALVLDSIQQTDFATIFNNMSRSAQNGKAWNGSFRMRTFQGEQRWMRGTARPETLANGTVRWNGLLLDISRQRRVEQDLKRAKEAAEIANRSKTSFLANVSHELRTPLNAIIGFSDVMQRQLFGPVGGEKYLEYSRDIFESGSHLLNIINDILDVSKIESGHIELHESTVDLMQCVTSSVRMVQEQANNQKLQIVCGESDRNILVVADERKLKQVLLNVLSNAIKFTPAGGLVSVQTQVDDAEGAVVTIRDTGIGMREQDLAVALSMFGRVRSDYVSHVDGVGLGLPLSKGLMECHGGGLTLQSAAGKGTEVTLRLPPERIAAY